MFDVDWLAGDVVDKPRVSPLSCDCQVDREVRIGGWVKTGREAGGGAFAFLEVNDGSCLTNLQVRTHPVCKKQPETVKHLKCMCTDHYTLVSRCSCSMHGTRLHLYAVSSYAHRRLAFPDEIVNVIVPFTLQVFVSTEAAAGVGGLKAVTSTGTSILVQGTLRRTPEGTLQVTMLMCMLPLCGTTCTWMCSSNFSWMCMCCIL